MSQYWHLNVDFANVADTEFVVGVGRTAVVGGELGRVMVDTDDPENAVEDPRWWMWATPPRFAQV